MSDELPEKIEALLRLLASSHGGPDVRWANERDIRRIARLAIEESTREKDREIAELRAKVPPKMYPIMNGPSVPWEVMLPHAHQAKRNHGQTLERLAERGGLGTAEAWAVVNGEEISCLDQGWWAEKDKLWRAYADRINLHYAELAELRERLERAQGALRDAELLNMAGSDELEWVEQHALAIREAKEGRNVL